MTVTFDKLYRLGLTWYLHLIWFGHDIHYCCILQEDAYVEVTRRHLMQFNHDRCGIRR